MTPERILAWVNAIKQLIGPGKVAWDALRGLFHAAGLTLEEQNVILHALLADIDVQLVLTGLASGRLTELPPPAPPAPPL